MRVQAGEGYAIVPLGAGDIDRIMALEARAFPPAMQASRQTVLHRFSLGHLMLGAGEGPRLIGTVAFSPIRFSPEKAHEYPSTFKAHSTQPVPPEPDTVCIYSLGIEPALRQVSVVRDLVRSALDCGRRMGLRQAVGDGQLPSFNGSEQVRARPEVRAAVERFVATGRMPSDQELLADPALAMYQRLTGCRFLRMLPDFIPEDEASGGWRVLLYKPFTTEEAP